MKFFMSMIPPTITHQEKKVAVKNGKPVFYEPPALKDAREKLTAHLWQNRPETSLLGPVMLKVMWLFPNKGHLNGDWMIRKPDTDNLQKLLKDCMTTCEFWEDDAQVCVEHVEKRWADHPGIWIDVDEIGGSYVSQ